MRCQVYELNSLGSYKYVVVLSEHNGRIVLSRHKERTTWETQGGHIEQGETPLEAAKRELYEESGAVDYNITPLLLQFEPLKRLLAMIICTIFCYNTAKADTENS